MVRPTRHCWVAASLLLGVAGALRGANADLLRFDVAYFHPTPTGQVITLFPLGAGKATNVTLPTGRRFDLELISFAEDGKSAYLQETSHAGLDPSGALVKIEFNPLRQSRVPGSERLGDVLSLTVSPRSGKIFAWSMAGRNHPCGVYEIDPAAGTHRLLRAGAHCGALSRGSVSPDGKRILETDGGQLSLVNVETGSSQPLGTGRGEWSPDGRWIAVAGEGKITLIDAANLSRRKLGSTGVNSALVWSPDSKHLLFAKQEWRCFLLEDAECLVILDIKSRKRKEIKSSHCNLTSPTIGWIDSEVLR